MPITDVDSQSRTTVTFTTAIFPTNETEGGPSEIDEAIDVDVTYAVSIENIKTTIAKTSTIELDVGDTISYVCSYDKGQ
ncbi:MAG: hypothetical protein MJ223_02350 [Mycoplasmoidaceae bacterium]|nr:hypothetical protein [Mycoplasmoidaceae bacterium]